MNTLCLLRLSLATAVLLGVVAHARPARAQLATPCDSCARCTAALATPGAQVELAADLVATGDASGPCVVVRGAGALIDGHEHTVRGGGTGVRVEARGVTVRNVRVADAAVGIELAPGAHDATLYHDTLAARVAGVRVAGASGARVVRCAVRGGRVGIAFGETEPPAAQAAPAGGSLACPANARVASPGAVVERTRVEGAQVGIAACDALPVLARDTVVRNGVGVLLGAPGAGPAASGPGAASPYDPCVCAPSLPGVRAGTTLLYSSGCGGCLVHEGWLPALRAAGHDIRAREAGTAHLAEAARFDAYVARCAPAVTDALGIPGCVPNYACVATGAVAKRRAGARGLSLEAPLASSEDVARFARECAAAAGQAFRAGGGASCVRALMRESVVCANRELDVRAAPGAQRFGGQGDSCDRAEGWREAGGAASAGCARSCPAELPPGEDDATGESSETAPPPPQSALPTPAAPFGSVASVVPGWDGGGGGGGGAPVPPASSATATPRRAPRPDASGGCHAGRGLSNARAGMGWLALASVIVLAARTVSARRARRRGPRRSSACPRVRGTSRAPRRAAPPRG